MANFNDQVNNYIGRYFAHRPLEIRRVDTMKAFERAISGWMNDYFNPASSEYKSKEKLASMDSVFQDGQFDEMDECDIHCSLYILYKEEHRVQKLAGRCFSWDNMEEAFIGIKGEELRLEKGRYLGSSKGFCIPRFDAMQAAVLITDYEVVAYGDSYIEADDMDEDLVHCNVYVGYGLVADIHIDTKEFDRFFGQAKVPYAEPFDAQVEADAQADAQVEADAQAETESAQIVAETASESTNEEDATECTICERITNKIVSDSYYKELLGFVFFDKRKCQEDIEDVKLIINYAIGLLRGVLCRFDDTQESVEKNAELSDDGCHLLRHSKVEMDVVRGMLLEMINNVENVELRARKYRRTDAKDRDLQ